MKENYFSQNDDIQFHLKKRMDWQELFSCVSEDEKEIISANSHEDYMNSWIEVMDAFGEIAGGPIAENASAVDKSKVKWKDGKEIFSKELAENIDTLKEFGLPAIGIHPSFGGMGAPYLMEAVGGEMLNRACPSTTLNVSWYAAIAHVIDAYASDKLKEEYIPKIASGEWSGNMALTEPDAGSDLGALRSYGVKQEDGTWKLYGTKRFISNGGSQVSLVLAKNKKGSVGLNALSLYLCPRIIDGKENIKLLKLEEKIALRGSATAELAFDGSTAYLIGKEGEGFQYMLSLMNDSRIGVGLQGLGLMEATWRMADTYAKERKTWGKPIAKHEMIAEMLLDLEVELKATRSLCYQAAYSRSIISMCERSLKQKSISKKDKIELSKKLKSNKGKLRLWTPLIKYWVGERSIVHARQAMQILGGYGFTTEYKAEWWVRESLIYSLYEGTSQIQALMCIKDQLKNIVKNPKNFIESVLDAKVKGFTGASPLRKKLYKAKQISQGALLSILMKLVKTNAKSNFQNINDADLFKVIKNLSRDLIKFDQLSPAFLHADRICEMKSLEALMEVLIEDAEVDKSREWVAERFIYKSLPRMRYLKSMIDQDDSVLQSRLDENLH